MWLAVLSCSGRFVCSGRSVWLVVLGCGDVGGSVSKNDIGNAGLSIVEITG